MRRRPKGFFTDMTNQEVLKYCFSEYGKDVLRGELEEKNRKLYREIKLRGLIARIKTKRNPSWRPSGFLTRMSDEELLNYCFSLYGEAVTRGEFERRDKWLYQQIKHRGMKDKIKSKLTTPVRPKDFFTDMTDTELLKYCFSEYGKDITRGELQRRDPGLYQVINDRRLSSKIRTKSILRNSLKNWDNFKVHINKAIEANNGEFPTNRQLDESDYGYLRSHIRYHGGSAAVRGKMEYTVKIKPSQPKGFLENWDNFKVHMNKAIEANNGEFPSQGKLKKTGYGYLLHYIYTYHEGPAAVRERIGYNQQVRIKLARQLEEIADQVAA